MYKLIITKPAARELKVIKQLHRQAIISALKELKEDPFSGKPLKANLTNMYSLRVGVFRIIYFVDEKDKNISVISAGHRSTVYEKI